MDFKIESGEILPHIVVLRRQIHQLPELSGEEWATCQLIRSELATLRISVQEKFAPPNTVALIEGGRPGRTVALRADIDALPISERNDVPYRSQTDGVMHACGHDAHTAMLLGAAQLLMRHRDHISGRVKLIFQSAEETPPGGAKALVRLGVMEDPKVHAIFAQHVQAHIPSGAAAIREGPFMASSDEIQLVVSGKSCHAAHPQRGVDPIWVSAQIVTALQAQISRYTTPVVPVVLSICTISGGKRNNIIADRVVMGGTMRTLDEHVRTVLREKIRTVAAGIAAAYGATCEVTFRPGYPCLVNDRNAAGCLREAAINVLGEKNIAICPPSTGSEDFAWYLQSAPGAMIQLGCGSEEKGIVSAIHTDTFDIDEACLGYGAALLAECAWRYLRDT